MASFILGLIVGTIAVVVGAFVARKKGYLKFEFSWTKFL